MLISSLKESLKSIRCYHLANELEVLLERAKDNDLSYADFLNTLLGCDGWITRFYFAQQLRRSNPGKLL